VSAVLKFTTRRLAAALILALAACLGGAVTGAQAQGLSALKDHDIDGAITWEADRSELLGREDVAILIGNVHVRQGDMELFSDRLHVFYELPEGARDPKVQRLDATDNVRLESPSETARAAWGVYDVGERLITLGGGVNLVRGDSQLDGERLEIDLESGVTKLDGRRSGAEQEERVRGRFVLPENGEGDDEDGDGQNGGDE